MQEIADWREKLGMSEYAQPFTEHEIDISVLGHLTDQDLKDIGIPLGHRRKILAAVGELTGAARRHPNVLPDRSRTHRTLPSAVKSRCRQTPQMVQSTTGS
jgi:SAM domain (Sterile alpha motif)